MRTKNALHAFFNLYESPRQQQESTKNKTVVMTEMGEK